MQPEHPALKITGGEGTSEIHIRLEPIRFHRHIRGGERWDTPFTAARLQGADFTGHAGDGHSRFEANVYAPEGFVDDEGDRCLLASLEFHHVALESAEGGIFRFTGTLAAVNAYSQDTYDSITAGTLLSALPELTDDDLPDSIRYLPPVLDSLEAFRGWSAVIECWALPAETS